MGLILQSMENLQRPRISDRRAPRCVRARAAPAQCCSDNHAKSPPLIQPRFLPMAAPVPDTLFVLPDTRAGEGDRSAGKIVFTTQRMP